MTPDDLRKAARLNTNPAHCRALFASAADAWDLERYDLAKSREEIEYLLKRLEAAERLIARIEEWDGKLVRDCRATLAGED